MFYYSVSVFANDAVIDFNTSEVLSTLDRISGSNDNLSLDVIS